MKITKVRYARLRNLGNYENERAECEVELEEGDSIAHGFARAKSVVMKQLGLRERVRVADGIVENADFEVPEDWKD